MGFAKLTICEGIISIVELSDVTTEVLCYGKLTTGVNFLVAGRP